MDDKKESPASAMVFELAKSSRSSCKRCSAKLAKGAERVGVLNYQYKSYSWYCVDCVVEEIKAPKKKTGLKCKQCRESVEGELLSVGHAGKAINVCVGCFARLRGSNSNYKVKSFGSIVNFSSLKPSSMSYIGGVLSGGTFDDGFVNVKRSFDGAGMAEEREGNCGGGKKLKSDNVVDNIVNDAVEGTGESSSASSSSSPAAKKSPKKSPKKASSSSVVLSQTKKTAISSPLPLPPLKGMNYFRAYTWNVSGLRALIRKDPGALDRVVSMYSPDIICIQEHKLQSIHVADFEKILPNYTSHWSVSTAKLGYSGVACLVRDDSKFSVVGVTEGCGNEIGDKEGRVLNVDYGDFVVSNVYTPNSGSGLERLNYRVRSGGWDSDYVSHLNSLKSLGKKVVSCGDFNVAHKSCDVHNAGAKHHKKQAGLTDEERASFDRVLSNGYVDCFRHLHGHEATGHYTFWSGRFPKHREENKGLRLDYFLCSDEGSVRDCYGDDGRGSDHAGVLGVFAF